MVLCIYEKQYIGEIDSRFWNGLWDLYCFQYRKSIILFCRANFSLSILESNITLGVHLESRVYLTNILLKASTTRYRVLVKRQCAWHAFAIGLPSLPPHGWSWTPAPFQLFGLGAAVRRPLLVQEKITFQEQCCSVTKNFIRCMSVFGHRPIIIIKTGAYGKSMILFLGT